MTALQTDEIDALMHSPSVRAIAVGHQARLAEGQRTVGWQPEWPERFGDRQPILLRRERRNTGRRCTRGVCNGTVGDGDRGRR